MISKIRPQALTFTVFPKNGLAVILTTNDLLHCNMYLQGRICNPDGDMTAKEHYDARI